MIAYAGAEHGSLTLAQRLTELLTPGSSSHQMVRVANGYLVVRDGGRGELNDGQNGAQISEAFSTSGKRAGVSADSNGLPDKVANTASIKPDGTITLWAHPSGALPIYFAQTATHGLVFSNRLRVLARSLDASPDPDSVIHFLRNGYIVGPATLFKGIRRLLPGQRLETSAGSVRITETSTLWASGQSDEPSLTELTDALVSAFTESLHGKPATLMMSGGWDSRTLLGCAMAAGLPVRAYSHGDPQSREIALVEALCARAAAPITIGPIEPGVIDVPRIESRFAATETAVFPHWHQSSARIEATDSSTVVSGVLGEVLGGHYGSTMLGSKSHRAARLARLLLSGSSSKGAAFTEGVDALMPPLSFGRHWYLKQEHDVQSAAPVARERAAAAIARLADRGIREGNRLIEAYISESRGAQYICAQPLSMSQRLDVAIPFGSTKLLDLSARVAPARKVHNSLNRAILARIAKPLLRFPMAATLVNASSPIALQEVSRVARRLSEAVATAPALRRLARRNGPRYGWVNFEFLRASDDLRRLVDSLRLDIWDKAAMHHAVRRLQSGDPSIAPHPLYDQLCKVWTVDLMLRPPAAQANSSDSPAPTT